MTVANTRVTQILLKRGNTTVSSNYIGTRSELTHDTGSIGLGPHTVRIHDGQTPGGWPLATGAQIDSINSILANVGSSYGNANVAAYLIANPQSGTYSNVNVEAYLGANLGAYQTYANTTFSTTANAASQQIQINNFNANLGAYQTWANAHFGTSTYGDSNVEAYIGANIGAYQTWANAHFGTSTYSNANVASYLPVYGGQILASTINNGYAGTASRIDLPSNTGTLEILNNSGDVRITSDLTNLQRWTFDTDGNITLPTNYAAINYANGVNILSTITSVVSSDTAPISPTEGMLWFDQVGGRLYIWYDSTWVDVSIGGGGGYGNASVAAYLPTDSNIHAIWSNIANLTAFTTYANSTFGTSSYGNTEVSAYLLHNRIQTLESLDFMHTGPFGTYPYMGLELTDQNTLAVRVNDSSGDYTGSAIEIDRISKSTTFYGNVDVNANVNVTGNIVPTANVTYDLGSENFRWKDLWLSGNTIHLGNTALSSTNGNLNIGSTNFTWSFGTDSNMYFPDASRMQLGSANTWIGWNDSDTNYLELRSGTPTANVSYSYMDQHNYKWEAYTEVDRDGESPTWAGIQTGWSNGNTQQPEVFIENYRDNTAYRWTFDANGNLVLPNSSSIDAGVSGNGIGITTDRGTVLFGNSPEIGGPSHFHIMKADPAAVDLFFGDDLNFVKLPASGGVEITSVGDGQKTWAFSADGNIAFPSGATWHSNTIAKADYIRSGVDSYINLQSYDVASDLKGEINIEHNNIRLRLYDGTGNSWQFNNDGTTDFPDYTFPALDGTVGQVFTTSGTGTISWVTPYGNTNVSAYLGTISINSLIDVDTTTVTPTVGEVLKWNGTNWVPGTDNSGSGSSGIVLTDLHVANISPSGNGFLAYDNVSGTFSYAPPVLSGYATETYVSTAINNLINSAPGTLDTLGEIAANLATESNSIGAILNSITNTNNNVAAIAANVIQSDYTESNTANIAYIKNKPDLSVYSTTANAAAQAVWLSNLQSNIDTISANLGAYQTWANANVSSLQNQITGANSSIQTFSANLGAYQLYANANLGTATTNISSLQSNIGAYQTWANANAATQATSITTIDANIGAYQTWANATFTTYSNTNVAAYLLANPQGSTYSNTNVAAYLTTQGIAAQIQSDYTESNSANVAYIKNKPDLTVYATNANVQALSANLGAYQTWANANVSSLQNQITGANTNIQTFSANLGAYQTWANANAAAQATSITTIDANIGAYQTWANANAATQSTSITNLQNSINGTVTTANVAYYPNVTATTSNAIFYPGLYNAQTGNLATYTNGNLFYVPSTGNLTARGVLFLGDTNNNDYPYLSALFTDNQNGYNQVVVQNLNSGAQASSDFVVTANNGNDNVYFVDLGITNSTYNNAAPINSLGTSVFPNDGYLYIQGNTGTTTGGNLIIGTVTPNRYANIVVGGAAASNVVGSFSATGLQGNTNGFTIGYLDIPQNATNSNYVLTLTDRGKHVYSTSATNQTVYIPTNANVAFPVGSAVNFVLQGAGNIIITANSGVTMYLAGNSTATTTRTLSSYGVATLQKVATNTWFAVGVGLA